MDSRRTSRRFPGFNRLYELADPGSERAFVASIDLPAEDALGVLRGEVARINPIRGRWSSGASTPLDVVWTTLALPVLLSQRLVDVIRKEQLTGCDFVPCTIEGKGGESWNYYTLIVQGRCGAIADRESVKVERLYPGGIFPVWRGLYFDPESWDGSDFFMPDEPVGWVIVSERVKVVLEDARTRGAVFTRLDEVERLQLKLSGQ